MIIWVTTINCWSLGRFKKGHLVAPSMKNLICTHLATKSQQLYCAFCLRKLSLHYTWHCHFQGEKCADCFSSTASYTVAGKICLREGCIALAMFVLFMFCCGCINTFFGALPVDGQLSRLRQIVLTCFDALPVDGQLSRLRQIVLWLGSSSLLACTTCIDACTHQVGVHIYAFRTVWIAHLPSHFLHLSSIYQELLVTRRGNHQRRAQRFHAVLKLQFCCLLWQSSGM